MKYNPAIHQRKTLRLKGYDYSQAGLYFITICVQNRQRLFGNIENGKMVLNDAGIMIEKWYYELMNKFPDIQCDVMVIMPNHFHCIVENVGADLRVCPSLDQPILNDRPILGGNDTPILGGNDRPILGGNDRPILGGNDTPILGGNDTPILGEHVGSPLHAVVQWFKTMSTNEYIRGVKKMGWPRFDGKLWQRNYYEHIIRNEQSYQNISNYIINNPLNWEQDKFGQL